MSGLVALWVLLGQTPSPVTTNLRWRPRELDTLNYTLRLDLQTDGGNVRFECDLASRVVRVDKSGSYDVETKAFHKRASVDGGRQTLPDDKPTIERYNNAGIRQGRRPDKGEINALSVLDEISVISMPKKLVSEGDEWSNSVPADKKTGQPEASVKCRLLKKETVNGFPAFKVSFQYRQKALRPVDSDGQFWVSTADGALIAFEANVRNLSLGGDAMAGEATLVMRRVAAFSSP